MVPTARFADRLPRDGLRAFSSATPVTGAIRDGIRDARTGGFRAENFYRNQFESPAGNIRIPLHREDSEQVKLAKKIFTDASATDICFTVESTPPKQSNKATHVVAR